MVFYTLYCTQSGYRIIDFTLDLRIISDNLLFGQSVLVRENPTHQAGSEANGAGDGTRTRDNLLGRQGLFRLSYSRQNVLIVAPKLPPVKGLYSFIEGLLIDQ